MASSMSGQGEPNPAQSMATQVGKMELSCPLRTTRCALQENSVPLPYNKFLVQACSVNMAGYWHCSTLFLCFMDFDTILVYRHVEKDLGQYPAILTSHLHVVNNPYISKCLSRLAMG